MKWSFCLKDWFDKDAYIRRLKLLRIMHDDTQETFAHRLGIPFKRWNEYERGYAIPTNTIALIRQHVAANITDWILFGDRSILPLNFDERLCRAEEKLAEMERAKAKAERVKQKLAEAELRRRRSGRVTAK
jgi:transcriptional regulator with XRE-family HTH domain